VAHDFAHLALCQLRDYDRAFPGSIFSDPDFTLTWPEAYELQFKVADMRERRGEAIAGYKIGCISKPVQEQLGLNEPVIGHIFSSELHHSGATLDVTSFDHLAIEGEFAFRISEDVPDTDWLIANSERAIESAFPVIELHNHVFRSDASMRAQELIANNGLQAGLVLASRQIPLIGPGDLLAETITVVRNGQIMGSSNGSALPGGPLATLVLLARKLDKAGKKLMRGHIVLAGSPLPLYPAQPGDRFEVHCRSLPRNSLNLLL